MEKMLLTVFRNYRQMVFTTDVVFFARRCLQGEDSGHLKIGKVMLTGQLSHKSLSISIYLSSFPYNTK